MSRIPLFAVVVSMTAAALATGPTRAATTSALSTFTFAGQCTDCNGTATGSLVLQNYTLGQQIGDLNFVSFTYNGTNLFNAITIAAADKPILFGSIDPTLPKAETFDVSNNVVEFISSTDGSWCIGQSFSCTLSADFGPTHIWSAVADGTSVPEPMTLSLLGGGLLGLAALRRKV
jgi:hypothetical protein